MELSATTLDNWVAKTANLLQDEFDVGPGSTVAVSLPVHWQTAAVLLGVWSCGATVVDTAAEDDGGLGGVDVVLAAQDRLAALEEDDGRRRTARPLPASARRRHGRLRGCGPRLRPRGAHRRRPVRAVRAAGRRRRPGSLAGGLELTLGGLVDAAGELAGRLGIGPDDRILVDAQVAAEAGPVAWLLAPLAAGASIVLCRYPFAERLPERAAAERVTATLGRSVDGVRELGRTAEDG